jgi:tetratricopeptide (TPR) repeat protein
MLISWANLYLKNKSSALEAIEQAKSYNPNAASTMGSAACIMICLGEYEKGMKWLSKAMHLNASYPPAFNLCMALYHFKKKNYEAALQWSEKISHPSLIWFNIIRIAAYAQLGTAKSRTALAELGEEDVRELAAVTRDMLGKSLLDNELVERLHRGLKNAKLPLLTVA